MPLRGGEFGFEQRRRIGEHAVAERADRLSDARRQRLQPRAQHLVIVAAAGVDRHRRLLRLGQALPFDGLPAFRRVAWQIVHARGDHAQRARHQLGRAGALQAVRGHVVHAAVRAGREPGGEPRLGGGQIDVGHADLGKSKLRRPRAHLRQQLRAIHRLSLDSHPPILGTRSAHWRDEAACAATAQRLATRPALRQATVELRGPLGAGKTTFVRHLLHALGVQGRVKSPTYAVMEPYELAGGDIWHFDFFRFDDPQEWEDAGFRDVYASPGLKIAEWPEKAAGLLPTADLSIDIAIGDDDGRTAIFCAQSARGLALLP